MLTKLSQFIKSLNAQDIEDIEPLSLEVACAVLLCEVMRADGKLAEDEQNKLKEILSEQFKLTSDEIEEIIDKAIELSEHATDFYQFTSRINQDYQIEQRIKMVELLWQVAYADGHLASIEEHIIRKVADLLHLRHKGYILAKHAVIPK